METIFLDIYDEYLDDQNLEPLGFQHRYANVIGADDFKQFHDEIYTFIMENKNDGLEILSDSISKTHFVKICLMIGIGDQSDISDIVKFIEERYQEIEGIKSEDFDFTSNSSYLFSSNMFDEVEILQFLFEEINLNNNDIKCTISKEIYERGCSNIIHDILIGVVANEGSKIIQKLTKRFQEDHSIKNIEFDENRLRKNLSNYVDENTSNLYISSFYIDDNNIKNINVIMKSRYTNYHIVCDKSGRIKSLNKEDITQTRL